MNGEYSVKAGKAGGKSRGGIKGLGRTLYSDRMFLLMILPGASALFIFNYLPLPGILMAFQTMSLRGSNFFYNLFNPIKWVGLQNFHGYFMSPNFWQTTRNTLGYNLVFLTVGLAANVFVAVAANELWSKKAVKLYQTILIFPAFLSWVIVSYLLFSLLNPDYGVFNNALRSMGLDPVSWYSTSAVWPVLITALTIWKGTGLGSIYYFAAISGIDQEIYESARIDGASRFDQIRHITLPLLSPTMITLTILGLGGIIRTDFGLFYVATLQMGYGALYDTVSTIDTYTYSMAITLGRPSIGTAIGLYQSVVGLFTIIAANAVIRKIDKDSAMF
ncbi:MAG: ABC transporter permease subunit [Oscillospiraceae bacterium]|nr:ABC transporter permease subunit [Oscillospiraceae bacterium]